MAQQSSLSAEDLQIVRDMKQREFNLKKRQRAANSVYLEGRRYRLVLILLGSLLFAAILDAIVIAVESAYVDTSQLWRHAVVVFVVGTVLGALAGPGLMHTAPGRRLLARKQARLDQKYSGELHAGRRWAQFFYRDEDISPYIGQILYMLESEHRFDSVEEAVAYAKAHRHENLAFKRRGLEMFNQIAASTDLLVISSTGADGVPSSRFMRYVRSETPGLWYVTSAPDTPKVHEFDRGPVALITAPAGDGATISSNQVTVRRSERSFHDVAPLYREQVPRYLDGMTEADQACEVVYEVRIHSAKVDSWVDHDVVVFDRAD